MNAAKRQFISAVSALLCMHSVYAGDWNTNDNNVVLIRFDVAVHHTSPRAVSGLPKYSKTYDGVTFYFASSKNLGKSPSEVRKAANN